MDQRDDKIVWLAQAMMRSSAGAAQGQKAAPRTYPMTVPMLAATALLSAAGGGAAAAAITELNRPINRFEQVEIEALVFYVARQKQQTEQAVRSSLRQTFGMAETDHLNVGEFQRVRNYLRRSAQ